MTSGMPAVSLRGITVNFGAFTAVRGIDLDVGDRELAAVVGPTGCGKSTLLNVVTGLTPPSAGRVAIHGDPLVGLNRSAGYMLQQDGLLPWKTAEDNVGLGLVFKGMEVAQARQRARGWLAKVGLKGFEHRYPHQLSGGQRKRVAMAQVLIVEPSIVLMDEPFSALDVHTRRLMHRVLLDLWQQDQRSLIFITHDLEEAIVLADRVVVLSAGPSSRVIGDIPIPLPRPRNVSALQTTDEFLALYRRVWGLLEAEVEKSYGAQA